MHESNPFPGMPGAPDAGENGRHRGGMVISVYGERGAKDRLLCIQMTPRDCSRERRLRCEG
jgi:hypothetical protein